MGVTARTLEAQARWETEGCRRAIARYRDAEATLDPASLPPGQALLRSLVPRLRDALAGVQREIIDPGQGSNGIPGGAALVALEAERLAVLALSVCLRVEAEDVDGSGVSSTARSVCLALATALAAQIDFDKWEETADKSVLAAIQRRYPEMDAPTWRRLRKKLDGVEPTRWTVSERLQIGAAVLAAVTLACEDHFVIETRHIGQGRTETYLTLTDLARRLMDDRRARAEVARPLVMPMLMPPIPWRYD